MLRTVFDHVINQIVNLVDKQVDEVQERGQRVRAILLVGGFGANRYMHQRLKSAHPGGAVQVLQVSGAYVLPIVLEAEVFSPVDCLRWSAICRGATIWGLENATRSRENSPERKTVVARIARHNYGICGAEPFDESRHLLKDRARFQNGLWYANHQMHWLVVKVRTQAASADVSAKIADRVLEG
jgi:hypothetical protein